MLDVLSIMDYHIAICLAGNDNSCRLQHASKSPTAAHRLVSIFKSPHQQSMQSMQSSTSLSQALTCAQGPFDRPDRHFASNH
jgi:hypothetical protein